MAKRKYVENIHTSIFDNPESSRKKPIINGVRSVVEFAPRNLSQAKLLRAIQNPKNHIIFALGPAGVGKSFLVAKYAIKQLLEGQISKIVITRPTVETGESIGFLPGGVDEKMEPWLLPIYDVFMENEGVTRNEIRNMLAKGVIEIAPLQFMRGRSLKNAVVIADEMQNSDINQLKMLLTRIGEGSKFLITGDLEQSDKAWKNRKNGLQDFLDRLRNYDDSTEGLAVVSFAQEDILRHEIITKILDIYKD